MKWTARYFDHDASEGLDAILSLDERGGAMVAISGRSPLHMPINQFFLRKGGYQDGWMELGCVPGRDDKLLIVGADTCDSLAEHLPQLSLTEAGRSRTAGMAVLVGSAVLVLLSSAVLIGIRF